MTAMARLSITDDPAHILIVDDDRRIRVLLQSYLADNGFRVSVAASAAAARKLMGGLQFDLMVVDVMMPGENGLELTRALREGANAMPVLMLSALAETDDRVAGLQSGSDDYLTKPFEPRELLLRIKSILRRGGQAPAELEEISFGACRFDLLRGELQRAGAMVRLTTRERDMLRTLARRPGQAVSRGELTARGAEESARAVDVQINRLRRKIEDDPSNPVHLQTIRGAGYALYAD